MGSGGTAAASGGGQARHRQRPAPADPLHQGRAGVVLPQKAGRQLHPARTTDAAAAGRRIGERHPGGVHDRAGRARDGLGPASKIKNADGSPSYNLFGIKAGAELEGRDHRHHDHRGHRRPGAEGHGRSSAPTRRFAESFADYAKHDEEQPALRRGGGASRAGPGPRPRRRASPSRPAEAPATPPTRPTPTSSAASSTPPCACSGR